MIDIYGHIGLPRFGTAEDFLAQMEANGVSQALLSTAHFCPDILELARAGRAHPDRFRIVGLPVGPDNATRRRVISEQLAGGFSGIRLSGPGVVEDPELLDIVGRDGAFAIVVALEPWPRYAELLLQFLQRYPGSFLIGGHFAGPSDPALIRTGGPLNELFSHPRFHVAFSRQGLMDPRTLDPWAAALIEVVGWKRILWGSEWPLALWRNEHYADTKKYIDRFQPTQEQREDFFEGNAGRLLFDKPGRIVRAYTSEDDLMKFKVPNRIHLLPHGMQLDEAKHQILLHAYLARKDCDTLPYRVFVEEVLLRGLESLHGQA